MTQLLIVVSLTILCLTHVILSFNRQLVALTLQDFRVRWGAKHSPLTSLLLAFSIHSLRISNRHLEVTSRLVTSGASKSQWSHQAVEGQI